MGSWVETTRNGVYGLNYNIFYSYLPVYVLHQVCLTCISTTLSCSTCLTCKCGAIPCSPCSACLSCISALYISYPCTCSHLLRRIHLLRFFLGQTLVLFSAELDVSFSSGLIEPSSTVVTLNVVCCTPHYTVIH